MSAKKIGALILILATGVLALPASAGVYGDSLGKCLVSTSTDDEKQKLVEWIFSAIALNPSVSSYVNIPPEKRTQIDKDMAGLFEKLLGETCKSEAAEALKYEGSASWGTAFQLLGQVAGQQIFSAPEVSKGAEGFMKYMDTEALQKKLGLPQAKP